MGDEERDAAAVRIPPPLVYAAALIGGGLLRVYVVPFPLPMPAVPRTVLAGVLLLAAGWLMAGAMRLFRRTGQNPEPWKPTPEIVSTGVYRFSRNPMYVGMGLIQLAIGVYRTNGWIVALLPVSCAVIYVTAIRHEERYLERKFGERYLAYRSSVRRWL